MEAGMWIVAFITMTAWMLAIIGWYLAMFNRESAKDWKKVAEQWERNYYNLSDYYRKKK